MASKPAQAVRTVPISTNDPRGAVRYRWVVHSRDRPAHSRALHRYRWLHHTPIWLVRGFGFPLCAADSRGGSVAIPWNRAASERTHAVILAGAVGIDGVPAMQATPRSSALRSSPTACCTRDRCDSNLRASGSSEVVRTWLHVVPARRIDSRSSESVAPSNPARVSAHSGSARLGWTGTSRPSEGGRQPSGPRPCAGMLGQVEKLPNIDRVIADVWSQSPHPGNHVWLPVENRFIW
jgi:hypothetical protein